ncbi:NfeD family protein [Atopomonas sediminilitoris]|uniref:NfeD family protein n=1 Tax=Atopomonas sediminilitoris TaxID=2919919 RepID=UPI001F4E7E26|nr:NfeD family protein [Atopomonas sediminilitoris]MCJ8168311.1 NfeD family protein [Atopomonas sediminilitoris]
MWDYLTDLTFWDWLGFGTLLLIVEVFGTGGYFLWLGLAAAFVGVLTWLFPALDWRGQFLLFSALSVLAGVLWWRQQKAKPTVSEQPGLNQRGSELVGRTFTVHEAIVEGRGKIKAGDTLWLVAGPDLPQGATVKVTAINGVILTVHPLKPGAST